AYIPIATICQKKPVVLLEYPLSQFKMGTNIITNLTYRTQLQLASSEHKCNNVNGYNGYIPNDYERYENELFWAINQNDQNAFWSLLNQRGVSLIKLNKGELYGDYNRRLENWLVNYQHAKVKFSDEKFLVVSLE